MTGTRFSIVIVGGLLLGGGAQAGTLYDDLGDRDGVLRIVNGATDNWLADPRISGTFENTNVDRFKALLADQLCQLTGGSCRYKGRSMQASHEGLHLGRMQFNALVEGLQRAMDRQDIPFRTQNRLLALLAPMQRDVVSR